jgi:hypothetical protein
MNENGKIVFHKTFFTQKKKPYAGLPSVRFETSSLVDDERGETPQAPTISPAGAPAAAGSRFPALSDDAFDDKGNAPVAENQDPAVKNAPPAPVTGETGVEVDDKGIPFAKSSDGTATFGEVNEEEARAIGTGVAAPIKLSEGNESYGKQHIAAREEQLKQNGYNSVEEFVEDVARNHDEAREGNLYMDETGNEKETFLLVKKGDVLYVELSPDGSFYTVNSGGVFKNAYINKRGLLWNASTEHSTPSAATSDFPGTQLNTESGTVSALSQGNPSFDDKDNAPVARNQAPAEKNATAAPVTPGDASEIIEETAAPGAPNASGPLPSPGQPTLPGPLPLPVQQTLPRPVQPAPPPPPSTASRRYPGERGEN